MKNEKDSKNPSFKFAKGTKLMLGTDPITLTEDATLAFDGAENEQSVVGMLVHSKNLDVNRDNLKRGYNGFGIPLSDEQQAALDAEKLPTATEEKATEEEFQRVVANHEEAAAGRPVNSLDPDNVPSQQRAPVLGSPELKDVEKMNNMVNTPGDAGFPPLASKPKTDEPETTASSKVNESESQLVNNHATTSLANANGAPNTAVEVAKAKDGTGEKAPDSALTTDPALTGNSGEGTESTGAKTTEGKDEAGATKKTSATAKTKTAVKKSSAKPKTADKAKSDGK